MLTSRVPLALSNPLDGDRVPGTVGTPLPGVQAKLVTTEDEPRQRQQDITDDDIPGELYIRGRNLFVRYWNRPEATTRDCFTDDGWFRTGDIAMRTRVSQDDARAPVYKILGRASMDIIKVCISGSDRPEWDDDDGW